MSRTGVAVFGSLLFFGWPGCAGRLAAAEPVPAEPAQPAAAAPAGPPPTNAARAYTSGGPAARHEGVVLRLERLVAEATAAAGRAPLEPDARLDAAATDLAAWLSGGGTPPLPLVEFALSRHGIIEPAPHLIVATWEGTLEEEGLLGDLRARLPGVLRQGRYNRLGVGLSADSGRTRVVLALCESYVQIEPVPRALRAGAEVVVRGRLLAPYRRAGLFVTTPAGGVEQPGMSEQGAGFRGAFACGKGAGRYQIEITGEDVYGAQVVANFPIYCGVAPPERPPPVEAAAALVRTPEEAAERCFQLLNADRTRAHLPALLWDGRLAQVALGHSKDMDEHDFVGHVSPRTGTALDRIRRAGLGAAVVLENVARAYSPEEAERGFMDSPGHRANVLSREATHVGVGVVFGREVAGRREVFVTQLFVRRPMGGDARQGERQVLEIIEKRRRDKGLAELPRDGALDRAAQEFSAAVAKGRASRDQGQQATRRASELAAGRFGAIEALFVELPEAARLPDVRLFYDTSVRAVGIGVSLGDSPKIGPGALYVTVVLGKSR